MIDNRTTKLLPCPFCGGEATVERIGLNGCYYVACNTTDCCDFGKSDTEAEAIAAWNARAPVEYEGWFYLPKPKNDLVRYGTPQIEKTENGYRAKQAIEVIDSTVRAWGDELGEHVINRICDIWNTRAELGNETCKIVATSTNNLKYPDYTVKWYELSCGHTLTIKNEKKPKWCAVCGKAIE